jgi:hypothetical protein
MYNRIIQAALIIGAAVMIALIAEGAMLVVAAPTPDVARLAPDVAHVEPSGPIAALRMLVTLIQTAIVTTIVVKVGQHNQQKQRLRKQQLSH